MKKILITGGRGLIGQILIKKLTEKGYFVKILSRTKNLKDVIPTYTWNISENKIENKALEGTDYIIHLAGAGIFETRWTKKRKQAIINSRVDSANLIYNKLKESCIKPEAFISASATGYYGSISSDKIFTESDESFNDFLGNTCFKWESAANKFRDLNIRTTIIRTGIVLTKEGGALSKLKKNTKLGINSAIGSGKQYMPWIHIDDLCNIYLKAIEDNNMNGSYNAVAPQFITNKEFNKTLALIMKKAFCLPNIPGFVLKLFFGERADILLKGSRVEATKIIKAGYNFIYPDLEKALKNLVH